jgi:hypothetical protein
MDLKLRLLNARLDWCKRLRLRAGTRDEKEGWLAEEEGLHDALLGRDRSDLIALCYPSHVERYRLGFYDGQSLLAHSSRKIIRRYFSRQARKIPAQTMNLGAQSSPQGDCGQFKEKSR